MMLLLPFVFLSESATINVKRMMVLLRIKVTSVKLNIIRRINFCTFEKPCTNDTLYYQTDKI